jgi:D-glycero-D-manno-heptose 1,7-bisphosphate phosphatase
VNRTRALFLDRDGVINEDRGYVHRREDFVFCDGIFALLGVARAHGLVTVVVTNQSGIGHGYYTEAHAAALHDWMCAELATRGLGITRLFYCPYHPEAELEHYRAHHLWRKPSPGMLLAAAEELDLDLPHSILIGDQWTDIAAARAAGVQTAVLVGTPRGEKPLDTAADVEIATVAEAALWLEAHLATGG